MSDSDEKMTTEPASPAWQQAASTSTAESSQTSSDTTTLDQARKFLQDENVRDSSKEKKIEFLKSKGIEEADITTLLAERGNDPETTESTQSAPQTRGEPKSRNTPACSSTEGQTFESKTHHAPIITYPEFLTKRTKPPPLITASGLFNSLGVVAGVSTLVYGATKYIVGPMVDSLTEARIDFHENAGKNLTRLVEKLEQTVSEIPPTATKKAADGKGLDIYDDDSSYDDPTELFHRDIGVQTSPQLTPDKSLGSSSEPLGYLADQPSTITQQAEKLASLMSSLRGLIEDFTQQAEDYGETKTALDVFNENLNSLAYPPELFGGGSSYLYGSTRNEPDDEIKKAKDNIRRVKGVLLSTSNFPASRTG